MDHQFFPYSDGAANSAGRLPDLGQEQAGPRSGHAWFHEGREDVRITSGAMPGPDGIAYDVSTAEGGAVHDVQEFHGFEQEQHGLSGVGKSNNDLMSMSHRELADFASNLIITFSHSELLKVVQHMICVKDGVAEQGTTHDNSTTNFNTNHTLYKTDENPASANTQSNGVLNINSSESTSSPSQPGETKKTVSSWDYFYAKLVEFKNKHGHVNGTRGTLKRWIGDQRKLYLDNQLPKDRIDSLTKVGFWTDVRPTERIGRALGMKREQVWEYRFNQFLEFKEKNGHAIVPTEYLDNPGLGDWCATQRKVYRKGKMPEERLKILEEAGFSFTRDMIEPEETKGMSLDEIWEYRYNQLIDYRNVHGNCNVPFKYENMQLSRWVCTQRKVRKRGRMPNERYERLCQLGFEWDRFGKSNVR